MCLHKKSSPALGNEQAALRTAAKAVKTASVTVQCNNHKTFFCQNTEQKSCQQLLLNWQSSKSVPEQGRIFKNHNSTSCILISYTAMIGRLYFLICAQDFPFTSTHHPTKSQNKKLYKLQIKAAKWCLVLYHHTMLISTPEEKSYFLLLSGGLLKQCLGHF